MRPGPAPRFASKESWTEGTLETEHNRQAEWQTGRDGLTGSSSIQSTPTDRRRGIRRLCQRHRSPPFPSHHAPAPALRTARRRQHHRDILPRQTAQLPASRPAKLAPPRRLVVAPRGPGHPRHKQSLVAYLFPRVHDRYRERLIGFHLDTLPYYKHRAQSRIYRFLLHRQRRRRDQSRLVDQARRLLLGAPPPAPAPASASASADKHKHKNAPQLTRPAMSSAQGYGYGPGGGLASPAPREPGARRRRLAEMASNVYRASAAAASEIRESYNQSRAPDMDSPELSRTTIPGSFPDVAIVSRGHEQMVLFPSYAKRHVRNQDSRRFDAGPGPGGGGADAQGAGGGPANEQDYWQQEWARHEDEKAVVDIDVRGWIYNPHRGAITRRNRMLIGLARQLSGIPAPGTQQQNAAADPYGPTTHQQREAEREQQSIARQAREIEKRGQVEEETAEKGGYSEAPDGRGYESDTGRPRGGWQTPPPAPASPAPPSRTNTAGGSELSDAELAVANANLMARLAPFLTTPLVQAPMTLFFYNDTQSQSRTVMTDDSGHFGIRAALDFVPTHVRVLASEGLSCTEPIQVIEPSGVSMISDIDDTIKRSNIAMGAKEIFRNTFIRDLKGMTVGGVRELYSSLHDMGVKIHYCSNSPWQLYPVLATFFKMAGLPPGSLHLKQYTGMLQGIFEPVAERKKGTLERIMRDFPERRFLLVGDSGEADLEVYTELAVAHPKRIIAIFIRDVTTPESSRQFFDADYESAAPAIGLRQGLKNTLDGIVPALPPRRGAAAVPQEASPAAAEEDLIDLSEEPPSSKTSSSDKASSAVARKPPPRPVKPAALKGSSSSSSLTGSTGAGSAESKRAPPPPQPRRTTPSSAASKAASDHPLTRVQTPSSAQSPTLPLRPADSDAPRPPPYTRTASSNPKILPPPPQPPPPRRMGARTPSSIRSRSPQSLAAPSRRRTGDTDGGGGGGGGEPDCASDMSRRSTPATSRPQTPNTTRRVELWQRRLQRAQETLDQRGVVLYTWRHGDDIREEATGIVREQLRKLGTAPETSRKG